MSPASNQRQNPTWQGQAAYPGVQTEPRPGSSAARGMDGSPPGWPREPQFNGGPAQPAWSAGGAQTAGLRENRSGSTPQMPGKQATQGTGGTQGSQNAQSIRPVRRNYTGRNLFLDLPIAGRLALGFVIAALVAALASGVVGVERSQSLGKQTDFYHHLLQVNTSLTTGRSFLELMSSKLHQTVDDASSPNPSRETLVADRAALANLGNLYTQTLNTYVQQDLLEQHSDQMAFLNEAGAGSLAQQQSTLTSSTQRTWQYYQAAQQDILNYLAAPTITPANLKNAQLVLQQQGEPTNADALSALHSLIQLNDRLASAVDDATNVEIHNELLTTLIAVGCAFILIALVGWFISDTLVRRLRHLQKVTRAVEEGRINERVKVAGRDEIAEVSLAVNSMVDTIVTLLEETRQQRDALTGAAEHLFSDMRIVNAGDLRISATVSNDPIGMLANAFNFTVGRFRRFVLRSQTTVEQLDVVARQSLERSGMFISQVRTQLRDLSVPKAQAQGYMPATGTLARPGSGPLRPGPHKVTWQLGSPAGESGQDALLQLTRGDLEKRLTSAGETVERANLALSRLSDALSRASGNERTTQAQLQELGVLEQLLRKLTREVRQTQLNATNNFARLDSVLTSQEQNSSDSAEEQSAIEAQYQEFVRQAGSFAVEINGLSKRLAAIIQEMRGGLGPFQLEGIQPGEAARMASAQFETEQFSSPSPSSMANW